MGKARNYVGTHRKAVAGAVLAGVAAGVAAVVSGSAWQVILLAAVAGALGVGAVPNKAAGH